MEPEGNSAPLGKAQVQMAVEIAVKMTIKTAVKTAVKIISNYQTLPHPKVSSGGMRCE